MASHVGIPVLFGHNGIENKPRSSRDRSKGVGGAVVAERVGLGAPHEKTPLRARNRAAHDNDPQGAARPGDLTREVNAAMGASAVAA